MLFAATVLIASGAFVATRSPQPPSSPTEPIETRVPPKTENMEGLLFRAFKEEKELEIWVLPEGESRYALWETFPVLKDSGGPGPKLKEGDLQVPEGFYFVDRFNPNSKFHLSLGINYPNDRDHLRSDPERPGGDIFIHGSAVSIGCLAMGDPAIERIYAIAEEARALDHRIRVEIYPFRMEGAKLDQRLREYPEWADFWRDELLPGYRHFLESGQPWAYRIRGGEYRSAE